MKHYKVSQSITKRSARLGCKRLVRKIHFFCTNLCSVIAGSAFSVAHFCCSMKRPLLQTRPDLNDLVLQADLLGANLRRLRISRDMTIQQAADAATVSKSFVSMVESAQRSIRFDDVLRLVHAYDVTLAWFLSETRDSFVQSSLDVPLEAAMTNIVQSPGASGLLMAGDRTNTHPRLVLMRPLRSKNDTEIVELFLPPHTQLTSEPMQTNGETRGIVRSGTLLIVLRGDEYRASAGDEFCFDGRLPHIFRNYTPSECFATLIFTPAGL
jgi:transcriptional regulator with XRE-family HTH domain